MEQLLVTKACYDIGAVTCQWNHKFRCWRRIAEIGANLFAFRCREIESRIVSPVDDGSSDISCVTGNISCMWEIFFRTSKSEIILEVMHGSGDTEFFNTSSGSCGHHRLIDSLDIYAIAQDFISVYDTRRKNYVTFKWLSGNKSSLIFELRRKALSISLFMCASSLWMFASWHQWLVDYSNKGWM